MSVGRLRSFVRSAMASGMTRTTFRRIHRTTAPLQCSPDDNDGASPSPSCSRLRVERSAYPLGSISLMSAITCRPPPSPKRWVPICSSGTGIRCSGSRASGGRRRRRSTRSCADVFGTEPLDFDGRSDALLHAHDGGGNRYMEYVNYRGVYADLPLGDILDTFAESYNPELVSRD